MNMRFQDTASAYRLHRAVTNEADAISAAIGQYVGDDLAARGESPYWLFQPVTDV